MKKKEKPTTVLETLEQMEARQPGPRASRPLFASRPYSTRYTARGVPRRYLLSGIPPTLWETARARARREGVAMRTLILSLLEAWVKRPEDRFGAR